MFFSTRYAKIEVSASSPIVPFRETIVPVPMVDMVNEAIQDPSQAGRSEKWREFEDDEEVLERGLVKMFTPNRNCMIQIRALPLPTEVTDYLDENQDLIKTLDQYVLSKMSEKNKAVRSKVDLQSDVKLKQSTKEAMKEFKDKLESLFNDAGKQWKGFVDLIWAFGPKRVGPNLLINKVEGYNRTSIWDCLVKEKKENKVIVRDYDYSVISGFQLATLTGPLCDEPMRGVCFVVENWEVNVNVIDSKTEECLANQEVSPDSKLTMNQSNIESDTSVQLSNQINNVNLNKDDNKSGVCDNESAAEEKSSTNESKSLIEGRTTGEKNGSQDSSVQGQMSVQGYVSGQLMSIVKESCQKSFQTQPQRLMAAMYKCTIQATAEVLGKHC